jgi:hypothetical protein
MRGKDPHPIAAGKYHQSLVALPHPKATAARRANGHTHRRVGGRHRSARG